MRKRTASLVLGMSAAAFITVLPKVFSAGNAPVAPSSATSPFEIVVPGNVKGKSLSIKGHTATHMRGEESAFRVAMKGDVEIRLPNDILLRVPREKVIVERNKITNETRIYLAESAGDRGEKPSSKE
ncbi:MAG: hypothetical protein KY468_09755 [Armatimonadetes bacterium]|nr:hypothetical protein [Armatimonadota bacterium]